MNKEIYWFKQRHDEWFANVALRSSGLAARGLAMDMRCLMSKAQRRGFLEIPSGSGADPIDDAMLAKLVGASLKQVRPLRELLEEKGVFKRDANGTLFCPELVNQAELSATRKEAGSKGGNPVLVKQKDNPADKPAVNPTVQSPQSTNNNESLSSPSVQPSEQTDGTVFEVNGGMDIRPLIKDLAAKRSVDFGPSLDSVVSYAKAKAYPVETAERFHRLNVANGWKFPQTGKRIGDWQSALHNFVFKRAK